MKRVVAAALSVALPALIAAFTAPPAWADPHPEGRGFSQHAQAVHGPRPTGQEGHEGWGGHVFGPHWRETLTDAQRARIDGLHRDVEARLQTLKAEIGLREAEVNGLIIGDVVDRSAVRGKIDQIAELRRAVMQTHYDHVIEMRNLLSPEQRVTFDLELLRGRHRPH